MFNFPLCKLYSNSLMSSLNARRSWKFGSSRQESSNAYSNIVNLEILLTSNVPTSPRSSQAMSPRDPPLRSIGGSYDNFSSNGGPFTSHEQVRSDTSSAMVPVRELRFQEYFLPFWWKKIEALCNEPRKECSVWYGRIARIAIGHDWWQTTGLALTFTKSNAKNHGHCLIYWCRNDNQPSKSWGKWTSAKK